MWRGRPRPRDSVPHQGRVFPQPVKLFIHHRQRTTNLLKLLKKGQMIPMPANIARTRKYQYRRRLPHFQKSDSPLFITFCTGGSLILPAEARDLVLNHCLRERGRRVDPHAAVVMPDHVHLLLTALPDENGWPFSLIEIAESEGRYSPSH